MLPQLSTDCLHHMPNAKKIPLFILSYNRLTALKRSVHSYLNFVDSSDIVILDKGSCYKPLLEYYLELEQAGAKIIYSTPLERKDSLNDIAIEIEKHKHNHDFDYYIVTDPDISLEATDPDAIALYIYFLEQFPTVDIVGPMLRIIDIPKDYPAREWCWKRHADQFWRKIPETIEWKNKKIHYQYALIDTTFGLVRSTTPYKRLLNGVRVYKPYEALHLDWYLTESNLTEDQRLYMEKSNPNVAHWSGPWYASPPTDCLIGEERDIWIVDNIPGNDPAVKKYRLP